MSTDSLIEKLIVEMEQKYGQNRLDSEAYETFGCFENVEEAISAAKASQKQLMDLSMKTRSEIIAAMRKASLENAEKLAVMAHEETGFGRVQDKIAKNILAAEKTPGTEDLESYTYTGDDGMTLVELAPFGVIGSITPSTNPSSTIINNSISMVAAGNGVVYNPHPGAKKVCLETIKILNKAIYSVGGPKDLLTSPLEPSMETSKVIMSHKDIRMLSVTGGEAVVEVAMKSGKKVIAAGPGNPPVIVDETADIKKAANDIVRGASFDNNVLCIAEKEAFIINSVFNELIKEMIKNGAYELKRHEIDTVTREVFTTNKKGETVVNRKYVGKGASEVLKACNIYVNEDIKLIIAEVSDEHPFVKIEMLMPVLGLVRVYSIEEAINKAVVAENGCHHTAIMHSESVTNLTLAARALDTSIFVKNAPSYAGLGIEGEGFTTLTIATPTGEGLTSARSFTRIRRCTLSGGFRII
ncbi:aldehyde dehydrogenase EutE [Mycoplasmatota bacterium zrk1]